MHLNSFNCPLGRAKSSCAATRHQRRRPTVVVKHSKRDNAAASAKPAAADRAEVVNSSMNRAPIAAAAPAAAPAAASASQARAAAPKQQPQEPTQQEKQQPNSAAQPSTYSRDSDAIDGDIKIIGLGQRGISATTRLMSNKSMQSADFWVLDTDAKVLSSCGAPNTMRIPVEDDAQLSQAELSRLAAQAAVAAAAAPAQRPGSPVATCGVAFLVAGAGGIPGGSTLLLQVAAYLRRTGFFVVAALTRPFEFEGRRKLEEADALIEALQDVAQLVVVVPQGVLTRASAELTINEASAIADNTLEVSCRSILWALNVPEVLRASAGTMLWHGRDLRQYKRLLSPPLEVLLTCPGVGGLGRGLASLPVASLAEAGLASGLSTLAEDAVAAAAESPFLEHVMPRASGVLCVLSLPQRVLSHDFSMAESALNDPEKYAIRAAVQVAAMTVVELAGRHCEEVVVCAHVRPDWPHTDPSLLCLEATLLVLEDPAAAEEAAAAAPAAFRTPPPATSRLTPSSTVLRSKQLAQQQLQQPQQQQQQQQQQQRAAGLVGSQRPPASQQAAGQQQQPTQPQQQQQQPAASPAAAKSSSSSNSRATWSAMSAIAGGSAAAAVGQYKPPAGSRAAAQQRLGSNTGRPLNPSLVSGGSKPLQGILSGGVVPGNAAGAGSSSSSNTAQQQAGEVTLVPRMADKHVDTMVAQSLDLPPSAARWRHQQRREAEGSTRRRGSSHFPLAVIPWNSSSSSAQPGGAAGSGSGAQGSAAAVGVEGFVGSSSVDLDEDEGVLDPPRDVRSRVAGMLQQERRQQGWVADRD